MARPQWPQTDGRLVRQGAASRDLANARAAFSTSGQLLRSLESNRKKLAETEKRDAAD